MRLLGVATVVVTSVLSPGAVRQTASDSATVSRLLATAIARDLVGSGDDPRGLQPECVRADLEATPPVFQHMFADAAGRRLQTREGTKDPGLQYELTVHRLALTAARAAIEVQHSMGRASSPTHLTWHTAYVLALGDTGWSVQVARGAGAR